MLTHLKEFFFPVKILWKEYLASFTMGIISIGYGIFFVYFTKGIIELLEKGDMETLRSYFFILSSVIIGVFVTRYMLLFFSGITHVKTYSIIYQKYIDIFFQLDNNSIENKGTGKMISIIDTGIRGRSSMLETFFFSLIRSGGFLIASFVILLLSSRTLFFYGISILIVSTIISLYTHPKIQRTRKEFNSYIHEESRNRLRLMTHKFDVLINNRSKKEWENIKKNRKRIESIARKGKRYLFYASETPGLLADTTRIVILLSTTTIFFSNSLPISEIMGLFVLITYIDNGIVTTVREVNKFYETIPDVETLRETFEKTPHIKGYDTGNVFQFHKGGFEVHDLGFGYNEKNNIFTNLNLTIHGGKKTAFVGHSGSGKSTLMKLLSGYIYPTAGEIIIDGQKLSETKLQSYYQHIGYLTQEPSVFDGSIYENIVYGTSKEISEERIKEVIKLSHCEFIYELKDGRETQIGERGIKLSGGQKQRLAIAKIFLKNPEIIFLDEPTSALDSVSEHAITQALHNLFKHRTVIIIAHRLQTVKQADEIIVFDKGKIIEKGTHISLSRSGGVYQQMLELQSGFMV